MTTSTPTAAPTASARRAALTESTTRLALKIEEREQYDTAEARREAAALRSRFHTEMAELLALTPAHCPECAALQVRNQGEHEALAQEWARLGVSGGGA